MNDNETPNPRIENIEMSDLVDAINAEVLEALARWDRLVSDDLRAAFEAWGMPELVRFGVVVYQEGCSPWWPRVRGGDRVVFEAVTSVIAVADRRLFSSSVCDESIDDSNVKRVFRGRSFRVVLLDDVECMKIDRSMYS